MSELKLVKSCKSQVNGAIDTMSHIPQMISERVQFLSNSSFNMSNNVYLQDRLKALGVIANNTKFYMNQVKEKVNYYLNGTIPEIHLSYLIETSDMLNDIPRFALYIHLFSAVLCMGISAVFHLFYCHSKTCNTVLCRLDYAGVSLLIGGTNFSPNYYGLYCKEYQTLLYIFLGIIEGSCLLGFFCALHPKFHESKF